MCCSLSNSDNAFSRAFAAADAARDDDGRGLNGLPVTIVFSDCTSDAAFKVR